MTDMDSRLLREGEKAAQHGMVYLLALGTIKIIAGFVTGMTVIIADAISTFADVLSIFASYIGLKLSRKTADERFEYGYYKVETFAALLISIGIIYLGYYIISNSIDSFRDSEPGQYRSIALVATSIAIFSSYGLSKKLGKAGKKANSLSLMASAKDKTMDMYAGIAIFISILANYQGIPYVEGVVSIVIAIFILKVGILSSKESLFFLLDYWNDPRLSRRIRKVFRSEKDLIRKVKNLRLRRAGTYIFGQAFVEVNPFAGMEDLREELDLLQQKIIALNPYIRDFAIYSHIPQYKKIMVAVPIRNGRGLSAMVAETMGQTHAYLFAELKDGKIGRFYIKKLKSFQKKPAQLSRFLNVEKVNILIDNKLNSLIYYNLRRTHHVLIYPNFADIKRVRETLELLLIDK